MTETRAGVLGRADEWLKSRPGLCEVALFLLALAPRLFVATAWAHEPVWDGHYYHFGAERIAAGQGYSDESQGPNGPVWHPWCHYPVGYSGFLAFFYALFGPRPAVAVVVQALVLAATAAATHRLALSFLSHRRALVAGLITALHPGLVLYAGLVMTEPLAGLGLVVAPLSFLKLKHRPMWGALASGVVLGLTTLVRPQTVLVAPALALLAGGGSWKKRLAVGLIATAACFAVVLPWTARNCARMDGCAFVSTNAGWNLAIGSTPRATGRFTALHAEDGCTVGRARYRLDQGGPCALARARPGQARLHVRPPVLRGRVSRAGRSGSVARGAPDTLPRGAVGRAIRAPTLRRPRRGRDAAWPYAGRRGRPRLRSRVRSLRRRRDVRAEAHLAARGRDPAPRAHPAARPR